MKIQLYWGRDTKSHDCCIDLMMLNTEGAYVWQENDRSWADNLDDHKNTIQVTPEQCSRLIGFLRRVVDLDSNIITPFSLEDEYENNKRCLEPLKISGVIATPTGGVKTGSTLLVDVVESDGNVWGSVCIKDVEKDIAVHFDVDDSWGLLALLEYRIALDARNNMKACWYGEEGGK